MGWSTETALLVITRLAVSAVPLTNKGQGTAQQVLLSIGPCCEAALCDTGQCREGSVTSATSASLSYIFRYMVLGVSSSLQV